MLKKINVNNTNLYYSDTGKGKPFLFIHGAAASCNHVTFLRDFINPYCRVISLSLRFHLPNDPQSEGHYGADQHAKDVIAFINELQLEKVIVFGHSYGGLVALSATLIDPDKFSRLFLAEPSLPMLVNENPIYVDIIDARNRAFSLIKAAFKIGNPALAIRVLLDYAIGGRGFNALPEDIQRDMIANASSLYLLVYNQYPPTIATRTTIASLKIPVTILNGERCTLMYQAVSKELIELLPQTKLKIIEGVAHDLIYNAAEDCVNEILVEIQ